VIETILVLVLLSLSALLQTELAACGLCRPLADIAESKLVALVTHLLLQQGSIPVGKMGSMLHQLTNNHSLPAHLKERYGGLKKFLQRYEQVFVFENDHPYNPHVALRYPPSAAGANVGPAGAGPAGQGHATGAAT